jgi:hypothetical protein
MTILQIQRHIYCFWFTKLKLYKSSNSKELKDALLKIKTANKKPTNFQEFVRIPLLAMLAKGHTIYLGRRQDLGKQFFHSEQEKSSVRNPFKIGSVKLDFCIEGFCMSIRCSV